MNPKYRGSSTGTGYYAGRLDNDPDILSGIFPRCSMADTDGEHDCTKELTGNWNGLTTNQYFTEKQDYMRTVRDQYGLAGVGYIDYMKQVTMETRPPEVIMDDYGRLESVRPASPLFRQLTPIIHPKNIHKEIGFGDDTAKAQDKLTEMRNNLEVLHGAGVDGCEGDCVQSFGNPAPPHVCARRYSSALEYLNKMEYFLKKARSANTQRNHVMLEGDTIMCLRGGILTVLDDGQTLTHTKAKENRLAELRYYVREAIKKHYRVLKPTELESQLAAVVDESARTAINEKQARATKLANEAIKHLQMFEERSKNRASGREENPKKLLLWPILLDTAENATGDNLSSARTIQIKEIESDIFNGYYVFADIPSTDVSWLKGAELTEAFDSIKLDASGLRSTPIPNVYNIDYGYFSTKYYNEMHENGYTDSAYTKHKGVDYSGARTILSSTPGIISSRINDDGTVRGTRVLVQHYNSNETIVTIYYQHLASIDTSIVVGRYLLPGQTIGVSGSTGFVRGNHLHFEAQIGGSYTDPMPYLPNNTTIESGNYVMLTN